MTWDLMLLERVGERARVSSIVFSHDESVLGGISNPFLKALYPLYDTIFLDEER